MYIYTSFKTISNKSQQIVQMMLKLNQRDWKTLSKNIAKMMWTHIENIIKNTPTFQIWALILIPFACLFRLVAHFCSRPVFRSSGVYPLGPILASPGASLVRFCRFFWKFGNEFALNFEDSRPTNGTNYTFKQINRISKQIDNQSEQIIYYSCCLTKPLKSYAPGLKQ